MSDLASPLDVLEFWWAAGPSKWWSRDDAFDAAIAEKFGATYEAAIAGTLDDWSDSVDGALALIILLDQFSRNLNRQSPLAFAHEMIGTKSKSRAKPAFGEKYLIISGVASLARCPTSRYATRLPDEQIFSHQMCHIKRKPLYVAHLSEHKGKKDSAKCCLTSR